MKDLIIIGGGPAGLTAAIYAARKKVNFTLISEEFGGEPNKTSTVENYPGFELIEGPKLVQRWQKHLKSLNPDIKLEKTTKISKSDKVYTVKTNVGEYETRKLLLALGSTPRLLGIPGEKEYKGKGVSFCSTCDAPLFKDKIVAVVGGGNSALETVIDLEKYAKKIYLINNTKNFASDAVFLDRIKNYNRVEVLVNTDIKEIKGSNLIEKIVISENETEKELTTQGVFVNIGYLPNTKLVENLVRLDSRNQVEIDEKNLTSDKNITAAGDCTNTPYKQIIIAAGEGAKALLSSIENL